MKILSFIFLCIFGWFMHSPFSIVESTVQWSAGGRMESGIAESYTLKLVANYGSDKLNINDLWIDSSYFEAHPYKQNKDLSFGNTWEKGDTLYIKAVKRSYPDGKGELKDFVKPGKALPFKYSGAALIGYTLKGKKKYFVVEKFKKLPKVYNP